MRKWVLFQKRKTGSILKKINQDNYTRLFFKYIFNWKIIALQCCVGFFHTATRISHKHTYISPTPYPISPLEVVTEHQVELPLLNNNFPLAILHMAIPMSQCYSLNLSHPLLPLLWPYVC